MNERAKKTGVAMRKYDVKFYQMEWSVFGQVTLIRVGVGEDGIIWVEPDGLGARPEDIAPRKFNGPAALINIQENRIYINARALVELQAVPENREAMRVCMSRLEKLLKEKQLLPNHVNVQNN
ncbi:MAG: hypothetical protein WCO56_24915 [Verrucomicrobiota bacterium]